MICERCGKSSLSNLFYCEHCGERRFKAKIRLVDRSGRDNTLFIFNQDYHIGRDKSCDIFLDDTAVSRKHARLFIKDEVFYIEDLHSKNGIFVNGESVAQRQLQNYDCIQIGGAKLHFYFSEGDFPEERIYSRTGEFIQETLLKISREIESKNMLNEVLNTILDGTVAMTNAQEAMFWLPDESGEWTPQIGRNLQMHGDGDIRLQKVKRLILEIVASGKHWVFHLSGRQEYLQHLQIISGLAYRILAIALRSRKLGAYGTSEQKVLGVIFLRVVDSGRKLDRRKIDLLEGLANQAVVAIENSYLYNEALAKRKIDNELELAREIQSRLLPREIVQVRNSDIAAFSRPCNYVGGDYYDVLRVRDEAIAIAIADITGKGIASALLMSSLQGSLRAQISYENRPEHIVGNINQLLQEPTGKTLFATFFFCLYEFKRGILRYVNAGHNPPIVVRRDGGEELLKSSATALGIIDQNSGTEATVNLYPGDVVVFYTDGLTEAMDADMHQLGIQHVKDIVHDFVQKYPDAKAQTILDGILKKVEEHTAGQPQHDDLTLLVLKIPPSHQTTVHEG